MQKINNSSWLMENFVKSNGRLLVFRLETTVNPELSIGGFRQYAQSRQASIIRAII